MMDNKTDDLGSPLIPGKPVHPLKTLTGAEFAALGGDETGFVRTILAGELAEFVPQASAMPEDAIFHLIMGADGSPLLIADSPEAISDWLGDSEVLLVSRH